MDPAVERLKHYLPTDVVDRVLRIVNITDLQRQQERYRTLTLLCESLSRVLRYTNSNLGEKQIDGHYELCKFYTNTSEPCLCTRFRYALYDIENYSKTV